jgi:pectate lyase
VRVASDKTIVGIGTSGELDGVELTLRKSSNIILRNLKIHHVEAEDGDAIHLEGTHDVWIDHCELWADSPAVQPDKDKYDGLIDITRDSSDVTISWSYLHDHWKGMLIGASDSDTIDRRVTFHHNYIRNVNSRLPSYRGGKGHIYNSYFEDIPTSGVNSRVDACLRVEGNHFYRVKHPITTLDSDAGGTDRRGNKFEETTGDQASGKDCTWEAPYSYPLDDVEDVKALVTEHAGVGKTDPLENLP